MDRSALAGSKASEIVSPFTAKAGDGRHALNALRGTNEERPELSGTALDMQPTRALGIVAAAIGIAKDWVETSYAIRQGLGALRSRGPKSGL